MSLPIQKFGLAIDWETSGYSMPNYAANHQGLSFGAIIFDTEDLTPVESIYVEVKFDASRYEWDDGAEKIHGMSRAYLEANGMSQQEAAVQLAELVLKYNGTGNLIVLGHRPNFDIAFTDQLLDSLGLEFKYDPIKLDSAAFGFVMLGITKSDDLFDAIGLPPRQEHNALQDIMYTLDTIRTFREFFLAGLAAAA